MTSPLRAHGKALRLDFLGDWRKAKGEDNLINGASFDYGGFGMLEPGAVELLSAGMLQLPHMDLVGTEMIDQAARLEGAKFLGFPFARFTTSGYTMNLVAFPAIANEAASRGKGLVFLMDSSNHNSMFVGSWISRNVQVVRFEHNNVHALEALLIEYSASPATEICVAIEGNYSMEGGLPPLPAIVELKRKYRFRTYIDEAHSFLSIGKSGRGIVEHYQNLGFSISSKDVDCIGATLSKSAGTIGGIITSHDRRLDEHVAGRIRELHETGGAGQLPTVVKLRLMQIWRKSSMVSNRMECLRQHTIYVLDALHRAGLCVHSDYLSPVIVVIAVSMKLAGKFGAECHRLGLAVTFAGPPATEIWRSVGRLCINALLTKDDVEQLVRIVVQAAVNVGITTDRANTLISGIHYDFKTPSIKADQITRQNLQVDRELMELLRRQLLLNSTNRLTPTLPAKLLQHGDESLRRLGVGSSSVRQYWGTQLTHVRCEFRMANLFESMKRALGRTGAVIMPDARNAVFSTLAACISPPSSAKVTNIVLLPEAGTVVLTEALMSMKKHKRVQVLRYSSLGCIPDSVLSTTSKRKVFLTLFLTSLDISGVPIDLCSLILSLKSLRLEGVQILLDDSLGFGKLGSRRLGYLNQLEDASGVDRLHESLRALRCPSRFFLIGSFHSAFGLQGGFVVGEQDIIKVLHWTSRAFLFSTAPLPSNIAMAERAVEALENYEDLGPAPGIAKPVVNEIPILDQLQLQEEDIVESLAVTSKRALVY